LFADTHCHLNFNSFKDDLEATLDRAWSAGIDRILIPGTDLETSRKAIELCEHFPGLYAAVGIHPNDSHDWSEKVSKHLEMMSTHPRVVAIGEIGLDYYRDRVSPLRQKEAFIDQLEIAADRGLPVIVHSRMAFNDVIDILSNWKNISILKNTALQERPGVLHSYDEDLEKAKKAVSLNFFLGITGPVTFHNAQTKQGVVRQIPINNLLLETDAPFLTPHPYRGRRNEPAFIPIIAEKIAALRGLEISQIGKITSENADRLFLWRDAA